MALVSPDGVMPEPFRKLSTEQCQRSHSASLDIMERVGLRLFEQEAIDLLKTAGAVVFTYSFRPGW